MVGPGCCLAQEYGDNGLCHLCHVARASLPAADVSMQEAGIVLGTTNAIWAFVSAAWIHADLEQAGAKLLAWNAVYKGSDVRMATYEEVDGVLQDFAGECWESGDPRSLVGYALSALTHRSPTCAGDCEGHGAY